MHQLNYDETLTLFYLLLARLKRHFGAETAPVKRQTPNVPYTNAQFTMQSEIATL